VSGRASPMDDAAPGRAAGREEAARARLEAIARLLDSRWSIPGTGVRFGADAVLNLLPGVGLVAAKGVSAYLIWEARRLGVPTGTLLRMVGNVGLDALISAVPLAGWVGDVFYRANLRNMRLLREHLDRRAAAAQAPGGGGSRPGTGPSRPRSMAAR
jgi:uncharacterized protein DUF4112